MKPWNYLSLLTVGGLAMAALMMGACGDDPAEDDSSGGSSSEGGAGPASGPSSGSGPVTGSGPGSGPSSGSGGAPPGEGICGTDLQIDGAVYDGCLSSNCCDSFDPCVADADCTACLTDPMGAGCDTNTLYQAFQTCFDTSCPNAICGGMLATMSPNLNSCVNTSCCASFTPCEADADCNLCLMAEDPTAAGCDTNTLFTAYQTCRDMNCPQDICGTQIIIGVTYDNMSQDTSYEGNLCAQTNCCTDLTACADPTGDGFLEMDDPEVADCLACLQDTADCPGGAVKTAADASTACLMTNMCLN